MTFPLPTTYSSWYEQNYADLTGHGLWLRGDELNTLPPAEYHARPFRVLITRLSTYYDTAESFSHKVLYQIARNHPAIFPDFAFLPPVNDGPLFLCDGVPWLIGTSTKLGPHGFDCIAFSNAIVQELINVPVMLEKSNIPLKKSDRLANETLPLIILGGANALHTTVFFVPDPPVDGIFVGESTQCIASLFRICADAKEKRLPKTEILKLLESVPGFVQPDRPVKTKRQCDVNLDLNSLLQNAPVVNVGELVGRGNLQISEGCPCFCSFCSESFCRKPYRETPANEAIAQAIRMKAGMGLDKIDLYSFNFNMHSDFYKIIDGLWGIFGAVGLKSQRFDMLAHDPHLLDCLHVIGKTSITCGLEGISPRLRRYLHKSLSDDDLKKSVSLIFSCSMRELKIFLLITGMESELDFNEFDALLHSIGDLAANVRHPPRIIFSATPLVRFPWTPIEFEDAPQPDALKPIVAAVKKSVEKYGFEFRTSSDVNDYHLSQILVRAHDPGIYESLLSSIRETGYAYYRSVPAPFVNLFVDNCRALGISNEALLAGSRSNDHDLPWLTVETGVKRSFLLAQHAEAVSFVDSGHCLGMPGKKGECKACGACHGQEKETIIAERHGRNHAASTLREKVRSTKSSQVELSFLVDLKKRCRGLPRSVPAAALACALMRAGPACVPFYAGYLRSYWSRDFAPCWIDGCDIISLRWQKQGEEPVRRLLRNAAGISAINALLAEWGECIAIVPGEPEECLLSVRSPFGFEPRPYCERRGITYTLRKADDRSYWFEFTKQALKKKLIKSLSLSNTTAGGTDLSLVVTKKFDPQEFVRESF
jgi:hypothetical protein